MIPDHDSSLGPERYDPDWFLAQLSGREPDAVRSAVEPVTPVHDARAEIDAPELEVEPALAAELELEVEPELEVETEPEPQPELVATVVIPAASFAEAGREPTPIALAPITVAMRRTVVIAAALASIVLITGAAIGASRTAESVAIAARAPDKLPASPESVPDGVQLPTLPLETDPAPPSAGEEDRGWSSPIRGDDQPGPTAPSEPVAPPAPTPPSTPNPSPSIPAPSPTPSPSQPSPPSPEPTQPAEPSPLPSQPAEPSPEPSQPAEPETPDPGPTGVPILDDLCVLFGLC